MKKKVIAGLLGTAMVASLLAGCGSSNNTTDTTADTTAATEAAADTTADTAADAESEAQSVADAAGDVDLSNADVAVMYYTYGDTYIASVRTALDALFIFLLCTSTICQIYIRQGIAFHHPDTNLLPAEHLFQSAG